MNKVEKLLSEWLAEKLISKDQAEKIREYESRRPSSTLYSFWILGISIIGLGIISLIAANWRFIPDAIKLIGDFILLGSVGIGAFLTWQKKNIVLFESLLALLLVLTLASIGLVSQIFHTTGHLYEALFLSSFITLGLLLASQRQFVPALWAAIFFLAALLWSVDAFMIENFFHKDPGYILAALPFLAALLTLLFRALSGSSVQTQAFQFWVVALGLVGLIFSEFQYKADQRVWMGLIPAYLLSGLSLIGLAIHNEYRLIQKGLLFASTLIFMISFHLPLLFVTEGVVYAVASILVLGLFAVFFASLHQRRLFQFFLSLVGLRFLVLYFQALGGLAATGMGLVFSGVLIIGGVSWWNRHRKRIEQSIEEWVR